MSYLLIFITIFLFSTIEIAGKLIGTSITPSAITAYRFLIGGLLILGFTFLTRRKSLKTLPGKSYSRFALIGIINVVISMLSLQLAILFGKANISAILISANPLFVPVFSYLILKEKIRKRKILGLGVGLSGVLLIVGRESLNFNNTEEEKLGIFFGLVASVTFALYTVMSKKYVLRYGNMAATGLSFIFGSLILIVISLLAGFDLSFSLNKENIYMLLYLGIFVTGLAYLLFFEGLKKIPVANGSMMFFLKPIIASLLAFFILKEGLNSTDYVGMALIIISFFIR